MHRFRILQMATSVATIEFLVQHHGLLTFESTADSRWDRGVGGVETFRVCSFPFRVQVMCAKPSFAHIVPFGNDTARDRIAQSKRHEVHCARLPPMRKITHVD